MSREANNYYKHIDRTDKEKLSVIPEVQLFSGRKHPLEQRFWRNMAYILHMVALLNVSWWALPPAPFLLAIFLRFIVNYCAPAFVLSQCLYIYLNFKKMTLGELESSIFFIMLGVSFLIKAGSSKRAVYKKMMIEFIEKIHLSYWQKNAFVKKRLISLEKYIRWTTICLGIFVSVDGFLLNYIPLHYNIYNSLKNPELRSNGTLKLMSSIYITMPFNYNYDIKNWVIMHICNFFASGLGCVMLFVFDAVNYAMIFHLIGHIEIFKNDLKVFADKFEVMSEVEVRTRLIELIEYHSFIIKAFKTVQAAWGINVTFNYMFNLVIDSFILFQIMTRGKLYGFIFSIVFVVLMGGCILMSFILEEVRKQSEGLADAVYDLPWEKMSISNQKMVVLMLARVQPTLTFIGAGGMRTGVQPMIGIMKSTFTYYVMLKSTI